jgi:hypothetical protein
MKQDKCFKNGVRAYMEARDDKNCMAGRFTKRGASGARWEMALSEMRQPMERGSEGREISSLRIFEPIRVLWREKGEGLFVKVRAMGVECVRNKTRGCRYCT